MPEAKKSVAKKSLKKRVSSTIVVVRKRTSANDSLFPEKVAKARKILSNTQGL